MLKDSSPVWFAVLEYYIGQLMIGMQYRRHLVLGHSFPQPGRADFHTITRVPHPVTSSIRDQSPCDALVPQLDPNGKAVAHMGDEINSSSYINRYAQTPQFYELTRPILVSVPDR